MSDILSFAADMDFAKVCDLSSTTGEPNVDTSDAASPTTPLHKPSNTTFTTPTAPTLRLEPTIDQTQTVSRKERNETKALSSSRSHVKDDIFPEEKLHVFETNKVMPAVAAPEKEDPAPVPTPSNKHKYTVGLLVEVASRTWPGINKHGGMGRITKLVDGNKYNVVYILGGSERNVDEQYVKPTTFENRGRTTKKPSFYADYIRDELAPRRSRRSTTGDDSETPRRRGQTRTPVAKRQSRRESKSSSSPLSMDASKRDKQVPSAASSVCSSPSSTAPLDLSPCKPWSRRANRPEVESVCSSSPDSTIQSDVRKGRARSSSLGALLYKGQSAEDQVRGTRPKKLSLHALSEGENVDTANLPPHPTKGKKRNRDSKISLLSGGKNDLTIRLKKSNSNNTTSPPTSQKRLKMGDTRSNASDSPEKPLSAVEQARRRLQEERAKRLKKKELAEAVRVATEEKIKRAKRKMAAAVLEAKGRAAENLRRKRNALEAAATEAKRVSKKLAQEEAQRAQLLQAAADAAKDAALKLSAANKAQVESPQRTKVLGGSVSSPTTPAAAMESPTVAAKAQAPCSPPPTTDASMCSTPPGNRGTSTRGSNGQGMSPQEKTGDTEAMKEQGAESHAVTTPTTKGKKRGASTKKRPPPIVTSNLRRKGASSPLASLGDLSYGLRTVRHNTVKLGKSLVAGAEAVLAQEASCPQLVEAHKREERISAAHVKSLCEALSNKSWVEQFTATYNEQSLTRADVVEEFQSEYERLVETFHDELRRDVVRCDAGHSTVSRPGKMSFLEACRYSKHGWRPITVKVASNAEGSPLPNQQQLKTVIHKYDSLKHELLNRQSLESNVMRSRQCEELRALTREDGTAARWSYQRLESLVPCVVPAFTHDFATLDQVVEEDEG